MKNTKVYVDFITEKLKKLLSAALAAALVLSSPFIRAFGLWGTAFATLAGLAVQALALLIFLLARARGQFAMADI